MADKIEQWIEEGVNYFLVVGAGHPIGEDSIIKLLKTRGYDFI